WERRKRLMKHHTATHVVNAAAREILGGHVWQDGSHKSEDGARLDITHYRKLGRGELDRIEEKANEIVEEDLPVTKEVMGRREAEERHGFRIYQGGAVPGNRIRVVKIDDVDAEACGGTHVSRTGEIGEIRITSSSKVQDGTIRLEYVAGEAAEEYLEEREDIREELSDFIDVDRDLVEVAEIFSVEVEHLPRVVERFTEEWEERVGEVNELAERMDAEGYGYGERPRDPEKLFEEWKQLEKDIEELEGRLEEEVKEDLESREDELLKEEVETGDVGMLIRVARHVASEDPGKAVVLKGENAVVGASGEDSGVDVKKEVGRYAETVQGDENFAKGFNLKQKQF
ncbi:MAG: hypothetical protein ABEI07_02260, partial [Candidatus Nanohaloarchaea archaeon]